MEEPKQIRMYQWLLALPVALMVSWWPVGCAPQSAAVADAVPAVDRGERPEPVLMMVQDDADAAWTAVYAQMPDSERVRGDAEVQP